MNKRIKGLLFLMLVAVLAFTCVMSSAAVDLPKEISSATTPRIVNPELQISGGGMNIKPGESLQLTAKLVGASGNPEIKWTSSEPDYATVDNNGKVTGKKVGRTVITATAKVNGKTVSGKYAVNIVARENALRSYLTEHQVLSYMYSPVDDYYYTDDKNCWQDAFGFARIYDIVSPYFVLEYDYIRVFFPYDGQDFMVQLWKGQYGYVFYGGEIGIYHKDHSDKAPGMMTFFKCADEKYWPYMTMSVYHQELNGEYVREFTRDYDKYWWCTGFKNGHLRVVEPADELRIIARLTMNDKEMATLFADGLEDCGFKRAETVEDMTLDSFYHKGKDVYFVWQDISEAENTMPLKLTVAAMALFNVYGFFAAMFLLPIAIPPMLLVMLVL